MAWIDVVSYNSSRIYSTGTAYAVDEDKLQPTASRKSLTSISMQPKTSS